MVSPFIFGLSIFGSLWLANILIKMVNLFVTKGVLLSAVVKIFFYSIPAIVVTTLPMATLLAALLALGRLNSDSEVIACKAAGIGFGRLIVPVIIVSILVSISAFGLNEFVVPEANKNRERLFVNEVVLKKPLPKIAKDIFFDGGDQFKMFVRNYEPAQELMLDVTMFQFRDKAFPVVTEAKSARIKDDVWAFRDGRVIVLDDNTGGLKQEVCFDEWLYPVKSRHADRIDKLHPSENEMNISELYATIIERSSKGLSTESQWSRLYFKTSFPCASFFLILIGVPFAVGSRRSGGSVGIGLSILIMFAYYILIAVGQALGEAGTVHPAIGAWCPNLVAFFVGIILIWRAVKA
jgi:lipopolysaccharide export system permease protein